MYKHACTCTCTASLPTLYLVQNLQAHVHAWSIHVHVISRALTCKVLSCSSVSDVTFESENHTVTERIASGWFLQLGRGSGLDELVICLNCFVSSYIDEAGQNVIDL